MGQSGYDELIESLLSITENFVIQSELQNYIDSKSALSKNIYDFLSPVIFPFTETILGQTDQHYGTDLKYGLNVMNVNRLLKSKSLNNIDSQTAQNLRDLLKKTFSIGILTQLYLFHFPTQEKYSVFDLDKLQNEWVVDAVAADGVMGYYGDKQNPTCMNICDSHFRDSIGPLLKQQLGINIFRMGSFRAFFMNLYLAGALLVMNCNLKTKRT